MDNKFYIDMLKEGNQAFFDYCYVTPCQDCKYHYSSEPCDRLFMANYIRERIEKQLKDYKNKMIALAYALNSICEFECCSYDCDKELEIADEIIAEVEYGAIN